MRRNFATGVLRVLRVDTSFEGTLLILVFRFATCNCRIRIVSMRIFDLNPRSHEHLEPHPLAVVEVIFVPQPRGQHSRPQTCIPDADQGSVAKRAALRRLPRARQATTIKGTAVLSR